MNEDLVLTMEQLEAQGLTTNNQENSKSENGDLQLSKDKLQSHEPTPEELIELDRVPERAGIVTRSGHICQICKFLPTTKNKYRELQDHLVRKHFNQRIKEALPSKRPYICPEPNCRLEGKDWQALMRHYTGKHGVLETYLKEIINAGKTLAPNPKHHAKVNLTNPALAAHIVPSHEEIETILNTKLDPSKPVHHPERPHPPSQRRKRKPSFNSTGSSAIVSPGSTSGGTATASDGSSPPAAKAPKVRRQRKPRTKKQSKEQKNQEITASPKENKDGFELTNELITGEVPVADCTTNTTGPVPVEGFSIQPDDGVEDEEEPKYALVILPSKTGANTYALVDRKFIVNNGSSQILSPNPQFNQVQLQLVSTDGGAALIQQQPNQQLLPQANGVQLQSTTTAQQLTVAAANTAQQFQHPITNTNELLLQTHQQPLSQQHVESQQHLSGVLTPIVSSGEGHIEQIFLNEQQNQLNLQQQQHQQVLVQQQPYQEFLPAAMTSSQQPMVQPVVNAQQQQLISFSQLQDHQNHPTAGAHLNQHQIIEASQLQEISYDKIQIAVEEQNQQYVTLDTSNLPSINGEEFYVQNVTVTSDVGNGEGNVIVASADGSTSPPAIPTVVESGPVDDIEPPQSVVIPQTTIFEQTQPPIVTTSGQPLTVTTAATGSLSTTVATSAMEQFTYEGSVQVAKNSFSPKMASLAMPSINLCRQNSSLNTPVVEGMQTMAQAGLVAPTTTISSVGSSTSLITSTLPGSVLSGSKTNAGEETSNSDKENEGVIKESINNNTKIVKSGEKEVAFDMF